MKIALILTGQLRTYNMVKYQITNNILSQYDTNIFIGIDCDNTLQCMNKNNKIPTTFEETQECIQYFKPINSFILNNFDNEFEELKKNNPKIKNFKLLFKQYYVVKNTYNLLLEHINIHGTKYDIILRLRFDQLIWTKDTYILNLLKHDYTTNQILYNTTNTLLIDNLSKNKKIIFEQPLENTIYLLGYGNYKHYKYANDQFWFHNESLLLLMSSFYDNMIDLMTYCFNNNIGNEGCLIECMFYLYLINNNIILKKSEIKGIFLREFV